MEVPSGYNTADKFVVHQWNQIFLGGTVYRGAIKYPGPVDMVQVGIFYFLPPAEIS